MVEASALARASAAFLFGSPSLTQPLVIRPRRVSILRTEVQCHLPLRAVGIFLRFNSSASARWETMLAAISLRMVKARAAARSSAACLFCKAVCTPRLRDEAPPLRWSIRPSWPDLDVLS
jgi:hypothetical protein